MTATSDDLLWIWMVVLGWSNCINEDQPVSCLLISLLAIWNRCGRKKGHTLTRLPIMYLWIQYKKWYALKAMISAPAPCSVFQRLHICVCAHARGCMRMCVYDVLRWRSFVHSSPTGENGPSESENTTFSGIFFFFPLFWPFQVWFLQAVSFVWFMSPVQTAAWSQPAAATWLSHTP